MQQQPDPTPHWPWHRFGVRTMLIAAGVLVAVVPLGVLLVLITTGWAPLRTADLTTVHSLNRYASGRPGQVQFWKAVSIIGGPTVLRIAGFLAAVLLWVRHHRPAAVLVAAGMGGAALLSGILKVLVNRSRPVVAVPVEHVDSASFPSGHALTSFVAVGVVLILLVPHLSRRWRVLLVAAAVLLIAAVGFSRLLLGVHYLSDVLGSWLIGTALLLVLVGAFHRSLASRPTLTAPPTAR